jgi:hypothetical protein
MIGVHPRPRLFAYWLGELTEAEELEVEAHVFECAGCAGASDGVSVLIAALRRRVPSTLTEAAIARLEREGVRLRHTTICDGERVTVPFGQDVDLLVHRLQVDLAGIAQIDCELFDAADGAPLIAVPDVMFEPAAGEINLVCQRHYVERFPPDAKIRLVSVEPAGRRTVAEYGVLHVVPDRG